MAHEKQFVIGPRPWKANDAWLCSEVESGVWLSHCPFLRVHHTQDAQTNHWIVLGFASLRDEIGAHNTEDVLRHTSAWTGRWALIGNSRLFPDATASLGCYYANKNGLWVSSSPVLIDAVTGDKPHRPVLGTSVEWVPLPRSANHAARRLLPSQCLNIATGEVYHRPLLSDTTTQGDTIDVLESCLTTALSGASAGRTVWLPLTAGYDSRLVLAVAHKIGLSVRTFTLLYDNISSADIELPPRLAASVGYPHTFVREGSVDHDRLRDYEVHTGGYCPGHASSFATGQYDFVQPNDILLRGTVFEVGRCFYWKRLSQSSPAHHVPPADAILHGLREMNRFGVTGSFMCDALQEWADWANSHPEDIDWRDRLYWEQRLAGWAASANQSLDLLSGDIFCIANSSQYIGHVLGLPESVRSESRHQVEMIGRMAPALLRFPFNPPDALPTRVKRRVRTVLEKVGRLVHR